MASSAFVSGEPSLDDWLRRRALRNEADRASRTYVVCEQASARVIAYYCLAAGAVAQSAAPGRGKRNMPDPMPVMVLGRLAVDQNWQGRRIGPALLRDAVLRTLQAAEVVGIRPDDSRPRDFGRGPGVLRAVRFAPFVR